MKKTLTLWSFALAALLGSASAQALVNCNLGSASFNTAYNATAPSTNITQSTVTVTCTRTSPATDPATVAYSIKANNGNNPTGQNNQASYLITNLIRYDLYLDSLCATQWKGNAAISGTIDFNANPTGIVSRTFWGCVPAAQTGKAAGTYTDNVALTLTYGPNPQSTALPNFVNVSIATPATCTVSTPPGTVAFNYQSFGPATTASTPFAANCTNYLPYTLALNSYGGTLAGLDYTLALSTSSSTGTGLPQVHTINGTMAAGQAGTCSAGSCTGRATHTLTITY